MKLGSEFYLKLKEEYKNKKDKYQQIYGMVVLCGALGIIWLIYYHFGKTELRIYGTLLFLAVAFLVYRIGGAIMADIAETKFLKHIAESSKGVFRDNFVISEKYVAMFREGSGRDSSREVSYRDDAGNQIRFFDYNLFVGHGKTTRIYKFKVYSVSGLGVMPHIYLNYKKDLYSMLFLGEELPMPREFEKEYKVSIPKGYQLEALQILTPDVLQKILDLNLKCDIEIVNGEMWFFRGGYRNALLEFEKFQEFVNSADELIDILKPKLSNLRWTPVGDKTPNL